MCYFAHRICSVINSRCVSLVFCSKDAVPEFELRVALWSCALEDDLTLVNTPKKLAKKLRNSFGRSAGKKLCPLPDTPEPDTFLQRNPVPAYVCSYPRIEALPAAGQGSDGCPQPGQLQAPSEHFCSFLCVHR